MTPAKTIGEAIRERRLACDPPLWQKDAAAAAGMVPAQWCEYERGRVQPRMEQLERIASVLGCTVADLVNGTPPPARRRRQ